MNSKLLPLCALAALAQVALPHGLGACVCPRFPQLADQTPLFGEQGASDCTCSLETIEGENSSHSAGWTSTSACWQNDAEEYCVFSSATFGNRRGISVLTSPDRAAFLASTPGFTIPGLVDSVQDHLVPGGALKYKTAQVTGKGVGVIATQPITRGEVIMNDAISVAVDYRLFEAVPKPVLDRMQSIAVDQLPLARQSILLNLSTSEQTTSHQERIHIILRTNAFGVEMNDEGDAEFYAVFPKIARMNHDCRANADYRFDAETLTQHVKAVRPIAAGEEVTISYVDPELPREQRRSKLKSSWGFDCTCAHCARPRAQTDASDARLARLDGLRSEFHDHSTGSRATPQMAELMVSLFEQERLQGGIHEPYAYAAIEWNGVGEAGRATEYARLAVDYGLSSTGANADDVEQMEMLAADPHGHWSWMLRNRKRTTGSENKGG